MRSARKRLVLGGAALTLLAAPWMGASLAQAPKSLFLRTISARSAPHISHATQC